MLVISRPIVFESEGSCFVRKEKYFVYVYIAYDNGQVHFYIEFWRKNILKFVFMLWQFLLFWNFDFKHYF